MQTTGTLKIATPTDVEIVITRAFDAPRHLVWKAMTRPELIRQWLFLPPGWKMTRCEEDVRVGGAYRWEWAGPDGKIAMAMGGVYREVVPNERLVRTEKFEFGCEPQAGEQVGTMEFIEQGGGTLVKITVVYPSQGARDAALASGMERGMSAGYDKLEELLVAGAVG
jgi:uncharacterized protein YndB with AHSA1/START domain